MAYSLGVASLISLAFSVWSTSYRSSAFAFYMVPARLWEFSIGGLIWCLEDSRSKKNTDFSSKSLKPNLSVALHILSLAMIFYACAYLDEHDEFPGLLALLPCLAASLFIYVSPQQHFLTPLYLHRIWVKLGQMSYAIYLVHWPIITFYRHYRFDIELGLSSQIQIILVTLISAYGLHVFIEQPLRKKVFLWKKPKTYSCPNYPRFRFRFSLILFLEKPFSDHPFSKSKDSSKPWLKARSCPQKL